MHFRNYDRDSGACGLIGWMNRNGKRQDGSGMIRAIANMKERGNGLGGGFAAYGIYPEHKDAYAMHLMYDGESAKLAAEDKLKAKFAIELAEPIPTRPSDKIGPAPLLWRYFCQPDSADSKLSEGDFVVDAVMDINVNVDGAFVFSSGKNMGAFKAVGFASDVGPFFRLDEYEAYIWTAHERFPTNTQAWWGGAHPFCLLDFSVVHNGEISSYGINRRYLEMFGYHCTLQTDTEVMVYLFDFLVRKQGMPLEVAAGIVAAPFWKDIDDEPDADKHELDEALRTVYGSALVNGPFAILLGHSRGLMGLNDRIKLRPMVAAEDGDDLYIASEHAAIRVLCPEPEKTWMPKAGEPVLGWLDESVTW
jgi:glutamate synthase domain-containing protein 1